MLQCFKTITLGFFQFIDNKIDPVNLYNQTTTYIGRMETWVIVSKKTWELFQKKDTNKQNSKGYGEYFGKDCAYQVYSG